MIKFLKKRWYFVLVVFLIIGFVVYKNNQAASVAKLENKFIVKRGDVKDVLSLSGQIDADEKAALRFQTSGRLGWVGVKEGDIVKKYQTIASLDQRDLKNRLQKYLNSFANQRLSFEQTKDDYWNKQYDLSESIRKSAERTLQENQSTLDNSVLDVQLQSLSVEYANLFTPIEGVVTHVDTPYPGVNITPAGAEFDVVNPKTIYFSASADQTDVVKLRQDMAGKVNFDAYPEKTFGSNLYYVAFTPKTNETGTVYELRFKLNDQAMSLPLKMGMTGDLDILVKEIKDTLFAPSLFIKKDSKGSYVSAKENGKKVKKYVETGDEIDGNTIIKNGISAGEVIYD